MQFLIECKDKSLTVIYQKSIIVESAAAALSVGDSVKFFWPENKPKAKEYTGIIVAKDRKYFNITGLVMFFSIFAYIS